MSKIRKLSVRLDEKHYKHLQKQSQIAGIKFEPLIRKLIMGLNINPKPPDKLAKILRELSAIGNNINQIARISNTDKNIDYAKINDTVALVNRAWELVREAM